VQKSSAELESDKNRKHKRLRSILASPSEVEYPNLARKIPLPHTEHIEVLSIILKNMYSSEFFVSRAHRLVKRLGAAFHHFEEEIETIICILPACIGVCVIRNACVMRNVSRVWHLSFSRFINSQLISGVKL